MCVSSRIMSRHGPNFSMNLGSGGDISCWMTYPGGEGGRGAGRSVTFDLLCLMPFSFYCHNNLAARHGVPF